MTDIQAALGISQIKKIHSFIKRRHEIAANYDELFADLPLLRPYQSKMSYSSYHLYIVRLKLDEISLSHREVFEGLRSRDIGVNIHYIPVHLQPYFKDLGFEKGAFPESERYYSEAISLPIYPSLSSEDQNFVYESLVDLLK